MQPRNRAVHRIVLSAVACLLLLSAYVAAIHAFSNGQAASLVMGGFGRPNGVAFDSSGNLWIPDAGNARVLEFSLTAITTATQTSNSSSTATSAQGGGIPEFPYQPVAAAIFTTLVVVSFLLVRRRSIRRS